MSRDGRAAAARTARARTARARTALALLVSVAALTGCGAAPAAEDRRLVVLAAASLSEVVAELAAEHERAHPGTEVVTSTGGSSALAQQVLAGAPADVLVAASPQAVQLLVDAGETVGEPVVVARNRLRIAVPPGNPGSVRGIADLARPALTVALCAVQVPCGAAAERAFAAAGVVPAPDTLEQDVRDVLAKVRLGEVDAGLVYVTDVLAAGGEVEGVDVPVALDPGSDYPAVVLAGGTATEDGRAFVRLLQSPSGQAVLGDAGFAPPG